METKYLIAIRKEFSSAGDGNQKNVLNCNKLASIVFRSKEKKSRKGARPLGTRAEI